MPGPEAKTEKKCRAYAMSMGASLSKISWPGRAGGPDRLLLVPRAASRSGLDLSVLVELKREGETPKPHQEVVHQELRREGATVWVCDTFESFKQQFDAVLREGLTSAD